MIHSVVLFTIFGSHKKTYVLSITNFRQLRRSRYSDWLRAGRSGDRIPAGAKFSEPVQTGPGAHPVSRTMGTGFSRGLKRMRSVVDHPPTYSVEVKEMVEVYLYFLSVPSCQVMGWPLPLLWSYSVLRTTGWNSWRFYRLLQVMCYWFDCVLWMFNDAILFISTAFLCMEHILMRFVIIVSFVRKWSWLISL